jgi:hypothetical protein
MSARLNICDIIVSAAGTGKVPAELQALDAVSGATVANGAQVAAITDASVAHALNSTFSDVEVETALNALGTKINLIIAALEAFKIAAP